MTTHQSQLEADRESYRQLVQIATQPNALRIGYANGIVGAMVRDNAGRIVLVTLDRAAIRLAISELVEAERCLKAQPVADEEPPPDMLPSTPTSISSAPPAPDERDDETRGAT
mgnify:FL=1